MDRKIAVLYLARFSSFPEKFWMQGFLKEEKFGDVCSCLESNSKLQRREEILNFQCWMVK